jgi:hypothetical protein
VLFDNNWSPETCWTGSLEKEIRLLDLILVEEEHAFFFI